MRIRKHLSRIAFTGENTTSTATTTAAAATTTTTTPTTTTTSSTAAAIIPCSSTSPHHQRRRNNNVQTHICELNRSPWDVISFSPQISDLYFPHQYQVVFKEDEHAAAADDDDDSSVTENTIDDESVIAFKSITSLKEELKEEEEEEEEDEKRFSLLVDVDHEEKRKTKLGFIICNKTDGKGWKCRRAAKHGHSLCEHHITQLKSYHVYTHSTRKSDAATTKPTTKTVTPTSTTAASGRQQRNKSRLSGKPGTDFYYYSGFGPLWGKKRRGRGGEEEGNDNKSVMKKEKEREKIVEVEEEIEQIQIQATAHDQQTPLSYVDYDDENVADDDDDDDDDECGRKRTRKPIKARSLKSLL